MSPEFVRRAVREPAAADPDQATAQTIRIMCGHISTAARDPLIKRAAETALKRYARGGPVWALAGIDPFQGDAVMQARALAESIWWYAKHQIKFVHHQKQLEVWLGESHHLQLLISPDVLIRFPFGMQGDCAIFSMVICAMLEQWGLKWELCTVAWNPDQPNIFLHVYPRVVLPDGSRLALDASHGKFPGWSIPLSNRIRTAVWDESAACVPDAGEQRFSGLHAYRVRVRSHRGFGQIDETGESDGTDTSGTAPVDTTPGTPLGPSLAPFCQPGQACGTDSMGNTILGSGTTASQLGVDPTTGLPTASVTPSGSSTPQTGYVAPSQSSAQWAAFATAMAKGGMTLAEINMIQPGTVVAANGTILRQAAGYPVSTTGLLGSISSTSGGSMLLIGGAALLLVLFMSKK